MESKKLDIWIIALVLLMYCLVNYFNILPKEFYFENVILLSVLFAVILISYFTGIIPSLGIGVVSIFFYGSYVLYSNIVLGYGTQPHAYFWLLVIPVMGLISGVIGNRIHALQKDNMKLLENYSNYVTVDENTGLENVKVFYHVLNQYMGLAKRYKLPLSLMLVKVSYFDDIKGIVGPSGIKEILQSIGEELVSSTRLEDCGYFLEDGATYALLLFSDYEGSKVVKKRIKENISQLNVNNAKKQIRVWIELKVGVAQYNETIKDAMELRQLAKKEFEYDV